MNDLEIPIINNTAPSPLDSGCGTCGTHTCAAVRHIEDVAAELDVLRREVRACERHHAEDIRGLWIKIAAIAAAVAAVVPTGWATFLGLI